MSDITRWQQGNEHYLAAALAWLRLRLMRAASHGQSTGGHTTQTPLHEPEPPKRRLFRRSAVETPSSNQATPLLPPAHISEDQIAKAADVMTAAEEQLDPPPALVLLAQRFGLSNFERSVLLLCVAMELDTRVDLLCDYAQGNWGRAYPTFALALTLFDNAAWDVLSPERPLRFWRLIEINQPGAQPLTISRLAADEWVVNYIKGLNYLDDRLAPLLVPMRSTAEPAELPASQQSPVDTIAQTLARAATDPRLPVIQLLGADGASKRIVASQASAALNLHLYALPIQQLPSQAAELETLSRLWQRQSILLPVALYLDAREPVNFTQAEAPAPPLPSLSRFLLRSDGVFFLDTREVWPQLELPTLALDISKPTAAEQQAAWSGALGKDGADIAARLAGQFSLNLTEIRQISQAALAQTAQQEDAPLPLADMLWDACLMNTRPRLDALAQHLEPKATWDDIVLPDAELALLRQIVEQVGRRNTVYEEWGFGKKMNRGLGISALFTGQSGTGKTMAAEIIADELRLNLYRIDLSAVVSKYIGETEKNLRRLFDAAEDGGTILFFDEADAIFGKRSEVKDSHDRYANIEINYLLQRMEAYRGLAILTTNMKSALDPAFMRRLRFIVNFPLPSQAERKAIWQKVFPAEMPSAGLDFDRLARLNLTGGNIHGIALNAAFLAAHTGQPVTMPLILRAARAELRKLERPVNEADFRWHTPAGAPAA
ncbi:MAG: ATP-binding protein [Pyrinomonadaceae bacterium]